MVWAGAGWSAAPAAAASPFSDVPAWAEKHVTKMALQGILLGGTGASAGKFMSNEPVTREQAAIIALRFMGIADQTDSEVLVLPSNLQIKEDYKPLLNLAFQERILIMSEEVALAEKEPDKAWSKTPATREWITRLLVRAIGKESEARSAASAATSFSDDGQIDPALRGYINVAIASKLVNGVTPTTFKPKDNVTRATAATLFSRAQPYLPVAYPGQSSGVLLKASDSAMTVLHMDGSVQTYPLTSATSVYRLGLETPSPIAELKLYGEIIMLNAKDGGIGYVEQTNETPRTRTVEGRLSRVHTGEPKLTLLIGDALEPFFYDPAYPPTVADAQGSAVELAQLPVDVELSLTVDTVRTSGKIIAIAVKQTLTNKTVEGTVAVWEGTSRSLHITNTATGQAEMYPVAANAPITLNGINVAPSELKTGDAVTLTIEAGTVAAVAIARAEQPTVTGTLESIDKALKSINYKVNGKTEVGYLTDNATIKIEGYANPTLEDLQPGDSLTVTRVGANDLSAVVVNGRTLEQLNNAVVSSYDARAKLLIVFDAAGKRIVLDIDDRTKLDVGGSAIALSSAASYLTPDKKINVAYSGPNASESQLKAVSVSVVAKYTGTVKEHNVTARKLTLTLTGGSDVTVNYWSPSVEIFGRTGETISDIAGGDLVTVTLNAAQDQAATVAVHKTLQPEVVSVNASLRKVTVKLSSGVQEEWTVPAGATLLDASGTVTTLEALTAAGTFVNATYQGNALVSLQAVKVTYGRVSSVNTVAGTIDAVTPAGATVTLTVGTAPAISRDGIAVGSLSAIKTNDRVEVRNDENGKAIVLIVPAVMKTYWYLGNGGKTLNVLAPAGETNPQTAYAMHPQAYIHRGADPAVLTGLAQNTKLAVYVLRGKVVEVEVL